MKTRKKILFSIISVTVVTLMLFACEEEERGPLLIDSTNPNPISEAIVTNLPGGAKIEYNIPTTPDALYVQATYERNGKTITTSSSLFNNFVTLEGLRDTSTQDVILEVVDKSNNVSSAVSVTINPLQAPVDKMFESIDLVPAFGGVGFLYDNPENIDVEVLLYVKAPGSSGYVYSQSLFLTGETSGSNIFRSFPPEAHGFAIELVDRWDNITTRYEETITPIEEVELDRTNFIEAQLTGDVETGAFGWTFSNMLNGDINGSGMHTDQVNLGFTVAPYDEDLHIFTIDLGVERKLSRFIWWQRQDVWSYHHGNPRFFDIWGASEIPADNGASLETEGWTLLHEGEVIKPSGTPSGFGQATAADREKAAQGELVEFGINAPRTRYLRFVTKKNWANSKFIHLMEVAVYGSAE